MKIALLVAILLIAISVPTAYAATLQLVTENGNVFSIDFDEILSIYSGYNSTAPILNNTAVNQEIHRLVNSIVMNNSTQDDIDDLQTQITDLLTQLNSNSTSTETEIDRLADLIKDLGTNSTSKIDDLRTLIDQLNQTSTSTEILDHLQQEIQKLETEIDDLEDGSGVGAGALGSSGRLTTVPVGGILVHGTHTYYDTSGIINPTIPYFYTTDDFGWATLIDTSYTKIQYDIPEFGVGYVANPNGNTIEIVEDITTGQLPELSVNGLPADTTWSITNFEDDFVRAGVTNSAGQVLIPRTINEGVTVTRGADFKNEPDSSILDLGTIATDTITIDDWGIINDMHVEVESISGSAVALKSPTGNIYTLDRPRTIDDKRIYVVNATGAEMHGDWTLWIKPCTSYRCPSTVLDNWSMSINHGGDYSMIKSVSADSRSNTYNVEVSPISSYGTYNLDVVNPSGIGTQYNGITTPLDRTRDSGPDETHAVGGAELCPGDDLYVCLVENYNRDTWYKRSPLQFLVTFNKPVVNVDTRDFNILYCGSGYSTCNPHITSQNTALDVWHDSEQSVPNTSSISHRSSTTSPSVKLIINASSPNDRNVDHWKLNLTAPNGNTIVITDGSTTTLDSSGGIHEFYLGELADVYTGRGNWVLSVIDETYDDDPTTYYGDDPEGQINSWSIVRDVGSSSSKLTVSRVTPQGIEDDQYLIDIYRTHRRGVSGTFTLWLDSANNIESVSGETLNPRKEFGSNHHSVFHYQRYQPSAVTSIIVTNSTYDSITFQVGFGANVVGVDKTDFIVLENGVPDSSGPQVSTYTSDTEIQRTQDMYGVYDAILINNQRDGAVNNMTLNVDISHPRISDLEITLTAPDGTKRYVHNNVGGNAVDLKASFTPDFTNTKINGDWILHVIDTVNLMAPGTLNSWALNFSYEEPPTTYEELTQIVVNKGYQYTFVNVLAGPHKLNIYPNAPINNYCSGILFDAYNKESLCLPERNVKTATYNGNFYKPSGVANYNYTLPVTENLQVSKISLTINSDYNLYNVDKFTLTSPTGEIIVDMDYYGERFESGTIFQKDYYFESKIPINGNWKLHFDDYYAHNVNFSIQFGDGTLIYTSNAYMRYPMTVPVNISGVGASNTDCDSNVISLNYLDNKYEAGDIMMVPIVPQMSVLCMHIEGVNTVIHLADVSPQVQIAVIPPTSSSGGVATSGTSFFATKTGNVNAIFDVSTGVGYDIRRTLDYTDRYETHTCGNRLGVYSGNCRNDVMSNERSTWTSTVGAATSSSSTITTNINIYRNGILAANEKIINNDSIPIQIVASNVVPFSANQRIISNSNDLSINPVLGFYVESGDFVQLEITTYSRGSIALPPTEPATKYYACGGSYYAGKVGGSVVYNIKYTYLGITPPAPDHCDSYGNRVNRDGWLSESTTTIPSSVNPKPAAIVESTGTKWTKINGGYVIFTGS